MRSDCGGPSAPSSRSAPGATALALAAFVWLVAVAAGFLVLWRYQSTPGATAGPVAGWPAGARLSLDPTRPTLVMAVHPRCPCTRASLGELAVLLARAAGRVSATVLVEDLGGPGDGPGSPLWRQAAAIPGLSVVADPEGREARRFGAAVSGETLLFDPQGTLLFAGGITAARGHAGDNPGRSRILALLAPPGAVPGREPGLTTVTALTTTAAFGCGLFADAVPASARRP